MPKRLKCAFLDCTKKIQEWKHKCRCGNIYCTNHEFFLHHACKFDYNKDKVVLEQLKAPKFVKL